MARIRTIKPEFWVSEQIAECSTNARLLFVGLWNFCDDRGVHPARSRTLKAEVFPMDDCSAQQVQEWVNELISAGLVALFFASDGQEYWHVLGWEKHQKIDRPSFKYPAPNSTSDQRSIDEHSTNPRRAPPPGRESKGMEGSEGDSTNAHRTPAKAEPKKRKAPMPDNFGISEPVKAWAAGKGFADLEQHLESFKDKCQANGYTYADWDAAFMNAIRDDWAKLRMGSTGGKSAGAQKPAWEGAR